MMIVAMRGMTRRGSRLVRLGSVQDLEGIAAGDGRLGRPALEDRLLERRDLAAVAPAGADVLFELGPELADRVLDRPRGAVGEAADGGAGHDAHVVGELAHDVD